MDDGGLRGDKSNGWRGEKGGTRRGDVGSPTLGLSRESSC